MYVFAFFVFYVLGFYDFRDNNETIIFAFFSTTYSTLFYHTNLYCTSLFCTVLHYTELCESYGAECINVEVEVAVALAFEVEVGGKVECNKTGFSTTLSSSTSSSITPNDPCVLLDRKLLLRNGVLFKKELLLFPILLLLLLLFDVEVGIEVEVEVEIDGVAE